MIAKRVRGDILETPLRHIAFATNTEGFNDGGFAGVVSSKYWPDLVITGPKNLGEVLSYECEDKTFHALVCHSLKLRGWEKTPEAVAKCLDSLPVSDDESVAVVLMGSGEIGQMQGADVPAILDALARSRKKLVLYTL